MGKTDKETKYRKVSVNKVKLSEQPVGFEWEGRFLGFTESAPFNVIDQKTGEVVTKKLTSALFEDERGLRTSYIADMGLKSAISDANVVEGTWIKAVKCDKANIGKGRTMNQYDLFMNG